VIGLGPEAHFPSAPVEHAYVSQQQQTASVSVKDGPAGLEDEGAGAGAVTHVADMLRRPRSSTVNPTRYLNQVSPDALVHTPVVLKTVCH